MEDKDSKKKLVISVNKQCKLKIIEQMEKSICKIIKNDETFGTGFFCNIPHQGQNLKVLITSNHLINKSYINNNKIIKISFDDDKILKEIKIDDNKTIYTSKYDDITIIEMNETEFKDNKDIIYLDLEDKLYNQKSNNIDTIKACYIIQYTKDKIIAASYGNIEDINESQIKYSCPFDNSSIGFPIFNLSNNKIIGVHKQDYFGTILSSAIKYYKIKYLKDQIENEMENEIDIKLKINKNDINKEIYFLDNIDTIDINGNIHSHDNLKELNELNSKIYKNDKEEKYKKYFIPEEEGEYNIKLKFNINLIDCSFMFAGCKNIIDINFINFNTKYVKNME